MYKIEFHKEVDKDFKELGNKANINLSGYKKVYVNNKRVRIVYKIVEDKINA